MNGRQTVLALLLSFLLLTTFGIAQQTTEQKTYFPIVMSADSCVRRVGIAWYVQNPSGYQELQDLCGDWFYHSATTNPYFLQFGGIPMFWCDTGKSRDYYQIARDKWTDYDGIALLTNEADRGGQCDRTPEEAAIIWHTLKGIMPNAKFIGPNNSSLGLTHLDQTMTYYKLRYGEKFPFYRLGIHLYAFVDEEAWMAEFCSIVESHGYECNNIWATEMGASNLWPDAYEKMYTNTKFMLTDPRIENFAVYTNRSSVTPPDHGNLIDPVTSELTVIGKAWMDAMLGR